jgi:hypothetical protein
VRLCCLSSHVFAYLPACNLFHASVQLAGRVSFSYQGSDFVTPISKATADLWGRWFTLMFPATGDVPLCCLSSHVFAYVPACLPACLYPYGVPT